MTSNNTNTDNTELADEHVEPATFSITPNLRESVLLCGTLHGVMTQAVTDARRAAFVHLMATLNLACVLRTINQQASRDGVAVLALYKGYKGNPSAQKHALKITGGAAIPFTYKTARNYIKMLECVETRMQQQGGMTTAQVVQVLCDHAAALTSGAYDDPMAATESLWAPFLTAGSLREAYLELAPAKPAPPTLSEVLDDTFDAHTPFASWEEQRAKIVSDFGGLWSSLDTFVEEFSRYTTSADREAQASKLEDAARRLRAMKTQPDLPGINPNRQ